MIVMKFRTLKPSTTPIHSFFPKNRDISLLLFFTKWTHLKAMMWFENWYLRCLPYQFYCESNELGKLRCPEFCLLFSYSSLHCSFLPQSSSSCSASHDSFLQGFASVASWSLCLAFVWNKIDLLRPKKIDIKNYKMHPWRRWLGGFVDCHAGWLTSLRNGNRFILTILIILKTDPFS